MNSSGETVPSQLYGRCCEISINFCVIKFGHYILFGQAELYRLFGFKFAVTIIKIQFTFITVASGWLCYVIMYAICVYCKCTYIHMYLYMGPWYTEDLFHK